ncbi:MAG: SDR family NAD(P)-dependent oxidoreductase [Gemmataceae bacterium]|nr:SDR family NAD(P)-dependent oxidoreductase [Gemmataceae bacterium]
MAFANQVAVITGASSGIGWALAKRLAAQGCRVGLLARRGDRLAALTSEIASAGGTAAWAVADVADRPQTLTAFAEVRGKLGPVDLLIANAGVGAPTQLEPMNVAEIESMFRVNVLGVVYSVEAVLPEMLQRGRGHLAAVSSLAAYKGLPGESAYCASKAAVNAYLEGLRIQLRSRNVPVTTICPGFVRTPMTDVFPFKPPWLMEVDEAARRIVKALARRRKVYNFPWQTALLMKMTRWLPDWLIGRVLRGYSTAPAT